MGEFRRPFRCEVFTPQGPGESVEAASVVLPATDGLVGVLGGRAPLVAQMGSGPLTIKAIDGRRCEYFVQGGFAQMNDDVLTILAEGCVPVDQLDPEAVWDEIQQARQMPKETDAELARRDMALRTARLKFKLIQQRRGKPHKG